MFQGYGQARLRYGVLILGSNQFQAKNSYYLYKCPATTQKYDKLNTVKLGYNEQLGTDQICSL